MTGVRAVFSNNDAAIIKASTNIKQVRQDGCDARRHSRPGCNLGVHALCVVQHCAVALGADAVQVASAGSSNGGAHTCGGSSDSKLRVARMHRRRSRQRQ